MLEKEFKFYLENQERIVKNHNNKHIVIREENIIGSYDSLEDAYCESIKENEEGTFLIQYCTSGNEAYTQNFHSQVYFA